jgi:hypothetical protein
MSLPAAVAHRDQPEYTRAQAQASLKGEHGFDPREIGVRSFQTQVLVLQLECGQLSHAEAISEELLESCSLEGTEIPGKGEDIPPKGILHEESNNLLDVAGFCVGGEQLEPLGSDLFSIKFIVAPSLSRVGKVLVLAIDVEQRVGLQGLYS